MKNQITKNLDRIELHDAKILDCAITDKEIVLNFDWAGITDFAEENLPFLVSSKCELRLKNVRESYLEKETEEGMIKIKFPEEFPGDLDHILENSSDNDNEVSLDGLMTIEDRTTWINWKIKFDQFSFSWDKHITHEEWEKGKMPE